MLVEEPVDRRSEQVKALQKALGLSTAGQNMKLAQEVERVFQERRWTSLRHAEQSIGGAVRYSTIDRLRKGSNPEADTLIRWANAIGESPRKWLELGGKDPDLYLPKHTAQELDADPLLRIGRDVDVGALGHVPHIGTGIPAAAPRYRDPDEERTLPTARRMPDLTDVRTMEVVGSCMEPFLYEGDIIYVRPTRSAKPGQIVVAMIGVDGITCKRYRVDEAGREYLEQNDGTERIGSDRFTIVGRIVGVFRDISDPTDTIKPFAPGSRGVEDIP